jgi:hypothetical protein
MKITVKTAQRVISALESEIDLQKSRIADYESGLSFNSANSASKYSADTMTNLFLVITNLVAIKFRIREAISKFNSESIDTLTVQIAEAKELESVLTSIFDRNRSPKANSDYDSKKTYFTSGMTNADADKFRYMARDYAARVQSLKDKCAGRNNAGCIELDDRDVETLKEISIFVKEA